MSTPTEPTTGYLIWRLSTRWRGEVDRLLAPVGLTQAQFAVLAGLAGLSRSGTRPNQRQLAAVTGLEPLYVSRLARALEAAGLVERPVDPKDPRAVRLTLSDEGGRVAAEAVALVHAKHAELTAAIGGPDGTRNRALRTTLQDLLGDTPVVAHHDTESESTMTQPRVFGGRDLNIAAFATRSVLDTLLANVGITFDQWAVLRIMDERGGPADRDALAATLPPPVNDPATVAAAVTALAAAGLVEGDAEVRVSQRGHEVVAEVGAASARTADQLFDGIPADDQVVTKRVLDQLTERAQALRAELSGQAR